MGIVRDGVGTMEVELWETYSQQSHMYISFKGNVRRGESWASYTPPPRLNPTDVVFTKNMPNMGVGLFSKHTVECRQVLFSERPLLIYPLRFRMAISDGLSEEEVTKMGDMKFEKILQLALSEMTKEDVNAYMSLSNCHPESPPLYGIARTNVFGTGTDIEEAEGKAPYGVIES